MRKQFMVQTDWIITKAGAADDATLGAWLRAHAYCAPRLNGGRIKEAKSWSQDTTLRVCGFPRRLMDAMVVADIAAWDNEDLILLGYDADGETQWQSKSHGGKKGRAIQLGKPLVDLQGNPAAIDSGNARGVPEGEPKGVPGGKPRGMLRRDSECESDSESGESSASSSSPFIPGPKTTTAATTLEQAQGGEPQEGDQKPEPAKTKVTKEALSRRVEAVSPNRVKSALMEGSLTGLLEAYGCTVNEGNAGEWAREANGMQLGLVAVVLGWRMWKKDPVRLPSGFAQARKAWAALNDTTRLPITRQMMAAFGVTIEKVPAGASNGGTP